VGGDEKKYSELVEDIQGFLGHTKGLKDLFGGRG